MSAISGLWRIDDRMDAGRCCARMLAAQQIYGPHKTAQWDGGNVALGRSLYRLLPEDVHDNQPLLGMGGKIVLVADLRLDNREELAAAMGIPAEQARQLADASILLAAFEHWGEACLDRILGDYAFALWDADRHRLLLVRDPLGQRPLHYHYTARSCAFASMPKGLFVLPEIEQAPDEERIAAFVTLLPESGSGSFFKGVEHVEAGHVVTITVDGVSSRRYWDAVRWPVVVKNRDDYGEALRHLMDVATKARLRGVSAEVGAHLSAGLDSSIVAGTAARLLAASGRRLIAFTGAPRQGYAGEHSNERIDDESVHAAATAAMHANIEHVVVRRAAGSPFSDLDRYFYLFEQPVTNLCNGVWGNAINEEARKRKLSVMLTGYMGNLTISYNGIEALPQLLIHGRILAWLREVAALTRSGQMSRKSAIAHSIGPYMPASLWMWLNGTFKGKNLDVAFYTAINPRRLEELNLRARARERGLDFSYRPRKDGFSTRLWTLRRIDLGNFNKGTLGGWGIDQRDPTADRRVIEFCLNVPEEQFLRGGVTRALARQSFTDRVPAKILAERRRGQQGADWHEGLAAARGQVFDEIERMEECPAAVSALDLGRLRTLADNWPDGGWNRDAVTVAYRLALLRAISTGHFLRKASGSNR